VLAGAGAQVVTVMSSDEVRSRLRTEVFDALVINGKMPGGGEYRRFMAGCRKIARAWKSGCSLLSQAFRTGGTRGVAGKQFCVAGKTF